MRTLFEENPLGFAALVLFLLSGAVVLSALGFEHIGGYKPCPLCLTERIAWYVALGVSLLVYAGSKSRIDGGYVALLLMGGLGLGFLYNAGLAGYHAGVEWKWWLGPTSCTGGELPKLGGGPGGLLEAIAKTRVVRCDIAEFRLFGLSFSGYNFLLSLLAAGIALGAWVMTALRMKNRCE